MKIGIVNEYYPPFAPGGAEWSTLFLADLLTRQEGIEGVVVITPNYGAPAYEENDGVIVERFPVPVKIARGRRIVSYGWLANPVFYAHSARHIKRCIHAHRLDLVHGQNKQVIVGTVWAAQASRIPVVVTLRDLMPLCRYGMCLNDFDTRSSVCDSHTYAKCLGQYLDLYMPNLHPARRIAVRAMALYHRADSRLKLAMIRRADAVVTISRKMATIYATAADLNPARLHTIYNPISATDETPCAKRPDDGVLRIFYAGKLSWGKGPHLLLEALPAISATMAPRPVVISLAGDGPLAGYLASRAAALGAGIRCFLGQTAQADMHRHYCSADVVVVPSVVQEGFGRVALEALMAGAPVVSSNRGGLPEIVADGDTGLVVPPQPDTLAAAIVRILRENADFRARVTAAQPKLRTKFGADLSAQHVALYRTIVTRAHRAAA